LGDSRHGLICPQLSRHILNAEASDVGGHIHEQSTVKAET
jgi:hypothetical protein